MNGWKEYESGVKNYEALCGSVNFTKKRIYSFDHRVEPIYSMETYRERRYITR